MPGWKKAGTAINLMAAINVRTLVWQRKDFLFFNQLDQFFNLTNIHEWVPYSLFSVIVTGVSPPSVKRMPRQLYA